jgi:spermidine synthase
VRRTVRFGSAELVREEAWPSAWLLFVDGVLQSYVDLEDPTNLAMPYTDWMGQVIDRHWPAADTVSAVHVGGGGCAVPRFVAATRPGSEQTVFDLDGPLIDLVRERLDLDAVPGLRVEVRDGRAGVDGTPDGAVDLVVVDVFRGGSVVAELATVEAVGQVARILRPGGLYTTNLWDGGDLDFALRGIAAVVAVFPHVLVIAETGILGRRRPGNVVVAASSVALPVAELTEWAAADPSAVRCLTSRQLADRCGTAPPLTEAGLADRAAPRVRARRPR